MITPGKGLKNPGFLSSLGENSWLGIRGWGFPSIKKPWMRDTQTWAPYKGS